MKKRKHMMSKKEMDAMQKEEAKEGEHMRKRKPKLGSGKRFQQLKGKLGEKGAKNPGALAAYIGRKKYGKAKFQTLAVHGKKKRISSPFNSLGKDDQRAGSRFSVGPTQGRRMTGKELLKKAMGTLVRHG